MKGPNPRDEERSARGRLPVKQQSFTSSPFLFRSDRRDHRTITRRRIPPWSFLRGEESSDLA